MYRLRAADHTLTLHQGVWAVGRRPTSGVFVDDQQVSRDHALIRITGQSIQLEDLGSRNGSFVNGQRVSGTCELRSGDTLRFGDTELILERDKDKAQVETDFTPVNPVPGTYPGERGTPTLGPWSSPPPVPSSARSTPPRHARLLLAVRNMDWAKRIELEASVHPDLTVETIGPEAVEVAVQYAVQHAQAGCLILDVEAVGERAAGVIRAWWGSQGRRGPVLIVHSKPEHEGVVLARKLGAQAYIRDGKSPGMVIAQARYQIQRAGQKRGAKK